MRMRRDDYYAWMTYVFGNLSYSDFLDEFLMYKPPVDEPLSSNITF